MLYSKVQKFRQSLPPWNMEICPPMAQSGGSMPPSPLRSRPCWLKIKQRIDYKILSLTYKVLTTTELSYLYELISLQSHRSTRYSDVVTLAHPPLYSSLKVNNRSFRYASPCLWNKLPKELRKSVDDESLSLSSHISLTSSLLSPSSSSLSLCITPSLFHSRLKTYAYLFHKSFPQ